MGAAGVVTNPAVLVSYVKAADAIAGSQLAITDTQESVEDVILTAAIGMHLHSRLILKIVALVQASQSIRRYGPERHGGNTGGRDDDAVPASCWS